MWDAVHDEVEEEEAWEWDEEQALPLPVESPLMEKRSRCDAAPDMILVFRVSFHSFRVSLEFIVVSYTT